MSKHFKTMPPLPYVQPVKMNCGVISVAQLVRRSPKLASSEENAASKNGLFPLVSDYFYLAFPMEGKER